MTAVEWLIDRIGEKSVIEKDRYYIPYNSGTIDITHIIEQAKEMEQGKICLAFLEGQNHNEKLPSQYYNETYGSKVSDEYPLLEGTMNLCNDITSSKTEISDEEILKQGNYLFPNLGDIFRKDLWEMGAKWYREQLKQRQ